VSGDDWPTVVERAFYTRIAAVGQAGMNRPEAREQVVGAAGAAATATGRLVAGAGLLDSDLRLTLPFGLKPTHGVCAATIPG
jgi:hypothetical protein